MTYEEIAEERMREITRLRSVVRGLDSKVDELNERIKIFMNFDTAVMALISLVSEKDPFKAQTEPLDTDACEELIRAFATIVFESQGEPDELPNVKQFSGAWEDIEIDVHWSLADIKMRIDEGYADIEPTFENCKKVAKLIEEAHDATIGINWDVIDNAIEVVFEK